MRNRPGTMDLERVFYRATLNNSLFEVIIDAAYNAKVSNTIVDLITIAWEANSAMISDLQKGVDDEQSDA